MPLPQQTAPPVTDDDITVTVGAPYSRWSVNPPAGQPWNVDAPRTRGWEVDEPR